MRTLVIAACIGYKAEHIHNWIYSLKSTGYAGDIAIIVANVAYPVVQSVYRCFPEAEYKDRLRIFAFGERDDVGIWDRSKYNMPPHVLRFFYLWNALSLMKETYDNVIMTDIRDVIFQKDPSSFGDALILTAGGEGLAYKDEIWGMQNFQDCYGQFFYNHIKDTEIINVGVFAGDQDTMKEMCLTIFQAGVNKPNQVVDQAVFNFQLHFYKSLGFAQSMDDVIHLGTTEEALKAGSGDLGQAYVHSQDVQNSYHLNYKHKQPRIDEQGYVHHENGLYTIVHQYDRIPKLRDLIDRRYAIGQSEPQV